MKKLLVFAILVSLLLAGCDLLTNFSIDDLAGTWFFGTQTVDSKQVDNLTAYIGGVEGAYFMDLWWTVPSGIDDPSYYEFNHYLNGTVDGNILTGTYDINTNDTTDTTYNDEDAEYDIVVTFTMDGEKLTISTTGTGPLAGKTFVNGQLTS